MQCFISLAILLLSSLGASAPTSPEGEEGEFVKVSENARAAVAASNAFAFDLYDELRTESLQNVFLAPTSISTAMAMTFAGAKGNTQEEMESALHFDLVGSALHSAFADLLELWSSPSEGAYELRMANRLWGHDTHGFHPEYLQITRERYGAELARADFSMKADDIRMEINEWVAEQTNDKITDMLAQGTVNAETRLILINAIYFKGKWQEPFKKEQTKDAPFYVSDDISVNVPMMHRSGRFGYRETDRVQLLELTYATGDLSMIIVLPKLRHGLSEIERGLSSQLLDSWLAEMVPLEVQAYIPRFTMRDELDLKPPLAALGMSSAFEPSRADFSGMNGRRDLFIGAAIHKTFVDVTEEGTEAAGATGVGMVVTAIPEEREFRADHPFLFLIRDNRTDGILFMGRLVNPQE